MKKMVNKKGQAYLIASLVIISLLVGFATISNYSRKNSSVKIYNLEKEYRTETERILDYALINGLNDTDLIKNFTREFSIYSGDDVTISVIQGNGASLTSYKYNHGVETYLNFNISSNYINTIVDGVSYQFKLRDGKNFNYIINQKRGDEKYVITG